MFKSNLLSLVDGFKYHTLSCCLVLFLALGCIRCISFAILATVCIKSFCKLAFAVHEEIKQILRLAKCASRENIGDRLCGHNA